MELLRHLKRRLRSPNRLNIRLLLRQQLVAAAADDAERLLALGVGAGVGWLLLRLGREGEASRPGSTGTR